MRARGLYLLTPEEPDTARLVGRVAPVLGAATWLQYRAKSATPAQRRAQVAALLPLCRAEGVALIVNDDPALAAEMGADGVHLGEHDGDIAAARAMLGAGALVGASCYDSLARARDAVRAGADHVAFGAFFPSPTKPRARRATPALLRDSATLGVARVAIGGITPAGVPGLVAAGADLVAVISGVFDAPDPVVAAHAYRACFEQGHLDAEKRGWARTGEA